jgi:hypothetical protein
MWINQSEMSSLLEESVFRLGEQSIIQIIIDYIYSVYSYTDEKGTVRTVLFDLDGFELEHSDKDKPAVIYRDGTKEWYVFGKRHRDNGLPAIEDPEEGEYSWYSNGHLHRDGGLPAVVLNGDRSQWWVNGQLHRENDLPAIDYALGRKEWFQNGKRHRDNGLPAVIDKHRNLFMYKWYTHGKLVLFRMTRNRLEVQIII